MHKLLHSKRHWLRWIFLFLGAVASAIILSHILNRPLSFTYRDVSSNPFSVSSNQLLTDLPSSTNANSKEVQIQSKYDRNLAHYATVSRNDGSFRQMFVNSDAIPKGAAEPNATIQPGKPLPDGTLLVMETWYSPENVGTVFVKQKQNGEWQYGSFSPDRPNYQMQFSGSCHSCHAPFPETDFTLTKPLLEAALQTRRVQTAYCDRAGRTPCNPEAYIPNAS
jgi:hypothetical protein